MPSKTAPDETEQWQYMEHHMYKYRVVHSTQQVKGHWETGAPHNPAQGIRLQGLTLSQRTYRATGGGAVSFYSFQNQARVNGWPERIKRWCRNANPFCIHSKLPGQGVQSFLAKEFKASWPRNKPGMNRRAAFDAQDGAVG